MTRRQPFSAALVVAVLAILTFGQRGEAGVRQVCDTPSANYHSRKSTSCAECHATGQPLINPSLGQYGPNAVCLRCHDGKPGVPDVIGGPPETYDGSERAGGHFAEIPGPNRKGHDLADSYGHTGLKCVDCHDPHGNGNYRNLYASEGIVGEAFVNPSAAGLAKYQRRNIAYGRGVEAFCLRCHQDIISESAFGSHGKHPSTLTGRPAAIGGRSRRGGPKTDVIHWLRGQGAGFIADGSPVPRVPFAVSSATSYETASEVSENNEVFCISCHKAHGSAFDFGLQWDYGAEEGEYQASGCQQCHNVGSQE